jgi:polyisoprenoid-binding protein YceI
MRVTLIICAICCCLPLATLAQWQLDPAQSRLSFMSTKAGNIAESHRFEKINGQVADDGHAELTIDLRSVNTGIPIRDQHMQNLLFLTEKYPQATFNTQLNLDELQSLTTGNSMPLALIGELNLHGVSAPITAQVQVIKATEKSIYVATTAPVIVNAEKFRLQQGVNQLAKVVNLPEISYVAPVVFVLHFYQK